MWVRVNPTGPVRLKIRSPFEYLVTSCLTFIVLTVDFQNGNENWRLTVIVFVNETRKCMIGAVCAENVC